MTAIEPEPETPLEPMPASRPEPRREFIREAGNIRSDCRKDVCAEICIGERCA